MEFYFNFTPCLLDDNGIAKSPMVKPVGNGSRGVDNGIAPSPIVKPVRNGNRGHDNGIVISPIVKPIENGNRGLAFWFGVGGCVILVGGMALCCFIFRKKMGSHDELEKGTGPRKYSYKKLTRATNNFSEEEKLGEGGLGGVYRGLIEELNSYVAVKRVSSESEQGLKEYTAEVGIIS